MELKDTYNLLAGKWAQNHWNNHYNYCDDFLNIMVAQLGEGKKILDIGCGSGEDCKFFADKKINAIGIDFSEQLINEAKKRFPSGNFLVMDILDMDFPNSSFDGVLAKHSLLHLPKKQISQILTKINSMLKPGGLFLLTLKEGIGEKTVSEVRFGVKINRFFSFYTNFEINKLLQGAGFEVVHEGIHRGDRDNSLKFLVQKL